MIPSIRAARQYWLLAAAGLVLSAITARGMVLVRGHQPAATIVVDRGASAQVQAAAKTLQAYVQKSTGALLPIADRPGEGVALHVGVTEFVRAHDPRGQALDDDGFVLDGTTPGNFVIVGGSDWGTEFGVYDFLERYLDVAWLMPTDLGEDVPKRATLEVPDQLRRDEPVYLSRQLSPLDIDDSGINMTVRAIDPFYVGANNPNTANNRWGRFNRARGRIAFHHNLVELFAPSVFANEHPEFYPLIDGKRLVPPAVAGYVLPRWQPNFSAPGIVDAAAGRIEEYFRAHPNVSSYSLGTNDNHGFDQSPASLSRRNGLKNYTGVESVSDDYFQWADSVADKVLAHYPDKWFGMLAYEGIAEPPTRVKVHPRIVPFITYDRMRWGDPKLREFGEHLTEQWAEKSPALGWYDYTYGAQYLVPRVWFHQMQEYLAWGAAHHVKFHYAELYPSWGEGPKPWLFTKLLWNPNQDVDQLLDAWYRHAAGPAGAAKLREFYSVWEGFWTKDVYSTHWNTSTGHYLPFSNPSYLLEVPEAYVARADGLMREALAATDTPEHRARVGKLAELWEFYKVSYEAYRGLVQGDQASTASEGEILSLLDRAEKVIVLAHRRQDLIRKFGDDPLNALVAHAVGYLYRYPLLGARWGSGLLWKAEPWVARSPRIQARIEELARGADPVVRSSAQLVLDAAGGKVGGPVANSSFNEGLKGWTITGMKENSASGFKIEGAPHGLTVTGTGGGSVSQTIAYVPGDYYAVVECRSPSSLPHGKATLGLVALNPVGGSERGPDGRRYYLPNAPVVFRPGESNVLALSFRLPPGE
ncbi:MAG: hypothetical protein JWM35_810, partial [Verrucomicrobia bacterium]|nr:hypothetical protein [Verrucomicrobiota bacterium]